MTSTTRMQDFLFYLIIGTTYAFSLSGLLSLTTVLPFAPVGLYLLCAGLMLAFYGIFLNKRTILATAAVLAALFIVAGVSLAVSDMQAAWFVSLQELADELMRFMRGELPYTARYGRLLWFGIAFTFSLLTALNLHAVFNFTMLLIMGMVLLLAPVSMGWQSSAALSTLLIFCLLVLFARQMNWFAALSGKNRQRMNLSFALAAIPLCLVLMAVAWLLPKPDGTGDGLHKLSGMVQEMRYTMGGDDFFSYSEEDKKLGGPITMDDAFVMEVYASERMYLSGSVRDTYTGDAWGVSDSSSRRLTMQEDGSYATSEYSEEMTELQQQTRRYYGFPERSVTIVMGENRTTSIFTPAFRHTLVLTDPLTPRMDAMGALFTGRSLAAYTTYTQSYTGFHLHNQYFNQYALMGGDASREDLPEEYFALPDDLPQRVYDLAQQIAGDKQTSYGKLLALEEYLQQFPYTLQPDEVPRGEDFVDYFLFEGQEGYCVYFASAMSVMARCLDIPTRYVEGFVTPAQTNANGAFVVTNKQAHAWMEAYFPAVGWVAFDPTPASFVGDPDATSQQQTHLIEIQPEKQTQPEPETEAETQPQGGEDEPSAGDAEPGEAPEAEKRSVHPLVILLLAIVILLAAGIALMMWQYRKRLERIEALSNHQAVEMYFKRIVRAAETLGYPMQRGETANAYAERVGGELLGNEGVDIAAIAEVFSRAMYSGRPVTTEDRNQMRAGYAALVQRLENTQKNRLQFAWNRYIRRRF